MTAARTVADSAITDRPWQGKCATTGLTMDDFRERLSGESGWTGEPWPEWVSRAAVSICRSYGLGRGLSDPAYMANVVHGEFVRNGGDLVKCDLCDARFYWVATRQFPNLCLDHSDAESRRRDGWTPENSVD